MLSDKPWKLETVMFFGAGVFACLAFGMLGATGLGLLLSEVKAADREFYRFLPGAIGLHVAPIFLAHYFLRENGVGWGEFLGTSRPGLGRAIFTAVVVALVATPLALALNQFSAEIITALQRKPAEMQSSMRLLEISYTLGKRILFTFAGVVLAPVAEEIIFRGVLYATVKEAGYPRLALFGTSLFFAAFHMSAMAFVPLTFFAIVMTLLYERTGRLIAPIVAHATFNAANIFAYLVQRNLAGST
jgi:membrane protease YdiL (CAAX protease family)